MLDPLLREDRPRLIEAMRTIETLLALEAAPPAPYTLRAHQPGDIGWIIHRHGVLYAQECGWGTEFEALIAALGAKFLREFDAIVRAVLDRRKGRRAGGLGSAGEGFRRYRPASAAAWWNRKPAAWASPSAWWKNASLSRAPAATGNSCW